MGFRLGQRTYVLEFDSGTYFDGAVIRVRPATIATVDAIETMKFSEGFSLFLEHVESWNLEDADGEPLKVDEDACKQVMEVRERNALVRAWYSATTGISVPLDGPSGDGEPSPDGASEELSIPMEPLSDPLPN